MSRVEVVQVEKLLPPGIERFGPNERGNAGLINYLWKLAASKVTSRTIYDDLEGNILPALSPVEVFVVGGLYPILSGLWLEGLSF